MNLAEEEFLMQCGSKCFIVTLEVNDETIQKKIRARTPVAARKTIRQQYGDRATILSATEEKN